MRNRSYGGQRLGLKEMARRGLIPREDDAEGERRGGTRISAQSFSAGNAAWKGRVGKDRSAPNSFGNNARSLRTMWAADGGLSSANSLKSRWGADGMINSADEQRASYGRRTGLRPAGQPQTSATGLKGDDYLGKHGTRAPVRSSVPGVRLFDFGGDSIYTWSSESEKTDLGFQGALAPTAIGYNPSISGEDYGVLASETASVGAGNRVFAATAGRANTSLTRTGSAVSVPVLTPETSSEPALDLWTEPGSLSLARSGSREDYGTGSQGALEKLLDELTGGRVASM